jgi:hypothetical protein
VFDDPRTIFRIYKIHGSLYWLRSTSGRIVKVPIKGLNIGQIKYLSDDSLSEMMIYPTLKKEKHSELYSWISNKFMLELNISYACVIIGYSFRDNDMLENIIGALHNNQKLWLVIISPSASTNKEQYFGNLGDMCSRIVSLNKGIEETITDRFLHSFLPELKIAREQVKSLTTTPRHHT